jgi:hypothetical protein
MDHDCLVVVVYAVTCVCKTFGHHNLLLWRRKCGNRFFFWIEIFGRNLRFAQYDIIVVVIVVVVVVMAGREEVSLTGDLQHLGLWYF